METLPHHLPIDRPNRTPRKFMKMHTSYLRQIHKPHTSRHRPRRAKELDFSAYGVVRTLLVRTQWSYVILACILCVLHINSSLTYYSVGTKELEEHTAVRRSLPAGSTVPEQVTWSCPKQMYTAWAYSDPMPSNVIKNIEDVSFRHQNVSLQVYCGNTQCVQVIEALNSPNIQATFLVVAEVLKDTPLENWLGRHMLYKSVLGSKFEYHLQSVVRLALILKFGGIYFEPTLKVRTSTLPACEEIWTPRYPVVSNEDSNTVEGILMFSNLPAHYPFTQELAKTVLSSHKNIRCDDNHTGGTLLDTRQLEWNVFLKFCKSDMPCPTFAEVNLTHVTSDKSASRQSYVAESRTSQHSLQHFPSLQFVPNLRTFPDNTSFQGTNIDKATTVFYDCWWQNQLSYLLPSENIHPMQISIQSDPVVQSVLKKTLPFMQFKEPIGNCDMTTLNFLQKQGASVYLLAPMSLLLKNIYASANERKEIYLVNMNESVRKLLPLNIRRAAVDVTDGYSSNDTSSLMFSNAKSYELFEKYSTAKLVITQNFHVALSCVALQTPVVYVDTSKSSVPSARITYANGYTNLFHTLDLRTTLPIDAKRWFHVFNWKNVSPNPNVSKFMRLRATTWSILRQNQVFHDNAKKLGVLPLTPPDRRNMDSQMLFHFIFTTTSKTNITIFSEANTQVKGAFNWLHWRAIESVFFHHPLAKVIVHSNTLPLDHFSVLTEASYDINIHRYDLEEMIKDTPAENFGGERLHQAKKAPFWYSNQSDLLRKLLLYKYGGIYMDLDVIIVRPLDELRTNFFARESEAFINGALLSFSKGHPFLEEALRLFDKEYTGKVWGEVGPKLLTKVYNNASSTIKDDLQLLDINAFYMFPFHQILSKCFNSTEDSLFDVNMKQILKEAYAVHINSKMTGHVIAGRKLRSGSTCKYILNEFCVLCDKMY